MKLTTLALSLLAAFAAGCATAPPPAPFVAAADLPNCFDSNYDAQRDLFTMRDSAQNEVNQQCALTVGPRGASSSRVAAGSYMVYLANGGGGGAGGTAQDSVRGGGGAGGGGAGAREIRSPVQLTEGVYRLTLGAGGPGGDACVLAPYYLSGGPGWLGSPSNIVRVATGEVVIGTPGAERYARLSRAQHDRLAGEMDGHGGSGPGQTSGGQGGTEESMTGAHLAQPGQTKRTRTGAMGMGGIPGGNEDLSSAGGGGGATSMADGGGGGGERPGHANRPPQRGLLGSGGGGGEGGRFGCEPGARGGHGYIALRLVASATAEAPTAPVVAPRAAPVYVAPPIPASVAPAPRKDRS